jgi:pyruvate-ferredoxin/flavodoxin oxidoreductase
VYEPGALAEVDGGDRLKTKAFRSREVPGMSLTVQVAPDDCTGCGVCVVACPAHDKTEVKRKSIDMRPIGEHLDEQRRSWDAFRALRPADPAQWAPDSVKTSQLRRPLFEFSGACAGCGETPYLKLLTQLFGDHMLVANATGCSSIYGGNLPTTPWAVDDAGRGPAWSNSLFEDNAEFGLGIRLAVDAQRRAALGLLASLRDVVADRSGDPGLVDAVVANVDVKDEHGIRCQRDRVARLREVLGSLPITPDGTDGAEVRHLLDLVGSLVHRSLWIVGGDGWAYDIGAGGLDHVLGSGRDVNILVLDTEVYSNTGGQASKATPRGAVAKFASAGKGRSKKDLGLEAMSYGDVYVAHVALGASDVQTVKALLEAEAWPGVSLVIAYSTCIAHGFEMSRSMTQQQLAVRSGHWPLYRYRPGDGTETQPFQLDSAEPSVPYDDFLASEGRFSMLRRKDPDRADELRDLATDDVADRWHHYVQLTSVERSAPVHASEATVDAAEARPDLPEEV